MKNIAVPLVLIGFAFCSPLSFAETQVHPTPNGIKLPKNYKDWSVISMSYRTDNQTMRVILGNDTAIKAARTGETNPWPKDSVLGKIVWKETKEEFWPTALAPDKLIHTEFMIKDTAKYISTGGWGYARWLGLEQKPYGKDANFTQECVACHTIVKNNDWVFTKPALFP